jgi:hypothetical protein
MSPESTSFCCSQVMTSRTLFLGALLQCPQINVPQPFHVIGPDGASPLQVGAPLIDEPMVVSEPRIGGRHEFLPTEPAATFIVKSLSAI